MTKVGSPRWHRILSIRGAGLVAPQTSGVYALGRVQSVSGLPTATEWVYIGHAQNLRRRLTQHDALTEEHPGLRYWIASNAHGEVWYASIPLDEAKCLEKRLIRALRPRFNRIRYQANQRRTHER